MENPTQPPYLRSTHDSARSGQHVCPWWVGYLLASPLRRLFENPRAILAPHVRQGMTVLDLGCAMGFFSLPLARMVGEKGRVVCVDVQERMITTLRKRSRKKGLNGIVETRLCTPEGLGIDDLADTADFALAFHVLHETPNQERFLRECFAALRPGGRLLLAEPQGHVSAADFARTLDQARAVGFVEVASLSLKKSRSLLYEKPSTPVAAIR